MLTGVTGRDRTRSEARVRLVVALTLNAAMTMWAMPASAQSLSPATVTVSDFAAVTLDGTAKTTTATMASFSVTDSAGAGWHVTVQATQLAEVNDVGQYVAGGKTIPTSSLSMPAPAVTPGAAVTVTPGPYAIDGATVQIASAASGATGTFDFTQGGPITLSLPAGVYARSYRSDVTVAVASGP